MELDIVGTTGYIEGSDVRDVIKVLDHSPSNVVFEINFSEWGLLGSVDQVTVAYADSDAFFCKKTSYNVSDSPEFEAPCVASREYEAPYIATVYVMLEDPDLTGTTTISSESLPTGIAGETIDGILTAECFLPGNEPVAGVLYTYIVPCKATCDTPTPTASPISASPSPSSTPSATPSSVPSTSPSTHNEAPPLKIPTGKPTWSPSASFAPTNCYDKYGIDAEQVIEQIGSEEPVPEDTLQVIQADDNKTITLRKFTGCCFLFAH